VESPVIAFGEGEARYFIARLARAQVAIECRAA
jgi:hypothetical protein